MKVDGKILIKGKRELLARRGGGEAGNTGGPTFRDDAVGAPIPLLRAILENDRMPTLRLGRRGRDRCMRVERGYGVGREYS